MGVQWNSLPETHKIVTLSSPGWLGDELARAPFGFHAIFRSDLLPSGKLT